MTRRAVVLMASLLVFGAATAAASAYFNPTSVSGTGAFSTNTLAAPTGLSATGGSKVTLNWTATSSTYATGTRILRGTVSGGPYSQVAQVTPRTTTTYTDYPPGPGTYYYVVAAYYQQWTSANTSQVSATRSAIAFVQRATVAGTTTATATFTTTPGAGNLLVAVAVTRVAGTIVGPLGWTAAIDSGSSGAPHQAIYYKVAGAAESKSVTITTTATGTGNGLHIYEYSGATTLNTSGSASGSGTANGSGSVTTTMPYTLVLANLVHFAAASYSAWSNGFAEVTDYTVGASGARTLLGSAGLVVTSTGTYSTVGTASASGNWFGQIVAFG